MVELFLSTEFYRRENKYDSNSAPFLGCILKTGIKIKFITNLVNDM